MFANKQFFFFLVTGGIAALCNFISRYFFNFYFSFSTSVVLAYLIGMITAFLLAKVFVFKNSVNSTKKSVLLFTFVNLLAVLQTWAVSMALLYWLFPMLGDIPYAPELAHLVGVVVPVFTSFIGHKKFTFKTA